MQVAALFAGDRDLSHYTSVQPLSRTDINGSRHDVGIGPFHRFLLTYSTSLLTAEAHTHRPRDL